MRARYFKLACLVACSFLLSFSALAGDQGISVYKPNSNGVVTRGCTQIIFVIVGVWTGTIGNATFATAANTQTVIPLSAVGDNQRLGEVPYTLAGAGSLIIFEVR